jgi:aldehyde dehydrogenase (NAD+)
MTYDADLSFNYFGPTKVVFEVGAVNEIPIQINELGSKAVLITDQGLLETGLVDKIKKVIGSKLAGVFADVPQDSGMEVVDAGTEYALSVGADVIVSLGGGSVIDTAKGISILMKQGGSLADFEGFQMLTEPQIPHISVPTTAGTGSEVSMGAVILNREAGQKIILGEDHIIPRMAVLDPTLTESLPPGLTASTGMDALTHAIEAFVATMKNPVSDALALWAMKTIARYLPLAVKNGSDLVARGQMQVAAMVAGWSFSNGYLGAVHAMSHSLGAIKGVPHGTANALLLPHVMKFNLAEIPELTADIGHAMGFTDLAMSAVEAGEAAIAGIENLLVEVGLPRKLSEFGVTEDDITKCSELAMSDGSIVCNPRMVMEPEEVAGIYQQAI